jgi:predicted nucleotidyltransferase
MYNSLMAKNRLPPAARPATYYTGASVPIRVIRSFARAVAKRFQPDKIILFGSHAYGSPHADSDVDILVIMPARNQLDQAYRIRCQIPAPFPMDLIVRTPKNVLWRLKEGESFLTQIMAHGKVLYEKNHQGMGAKGRGGSAGRRQPPPQKAAST